jgi:hypothetical protein
MVRPGPLDHKVILAVQLVPLEYKDQLGHKAPLAAKGQPALALQGQLAVWVQLERRAQRVLMVLLE